MTRTRNKTKAENSSLREKVKRNTVTLDHVEDQVDQNTTAIKSLEEEVLALKAKAEQKEKTNKRKSQSMDAFIDTFGNTLKRLKKEHREAEPKNIEKGKG